MGWNDIYEDKGEVQSEPLSFVETFLTHLENAQCILDLGCGTGRHSILLAKNGYDVTAYDKSERALTLFEKKLEEKNEGYSITLREGDFEKLPFEPASFDAVLSTKALHHGEYRTIETYINEMDSVLRPSGHLGLSVLSMNDTRSDTGEPYRGENNTRINCDDLPDANIPHHFFTENELHSSFADYDFRYQNETERVAMDGLSPSTYFDLILQAPE